jgi:rhamnulokinase
MSQYYYVACDLGAESGRVMLGTLADDKLTLEEIHRFPNGPVAVNGTMRWDVLRIFDELKTGLRKVAARNIKIESLSCDSWGVDYVWLRGNEPMLTAPFHYRDARTDGGFERAFAVVPREEIFAETGIQFMTLNTLYQLHADAQTRPWILKSAERFLTIGDYFNYLFSGVPKVEESFASTTQLYNPKRKKWSRTLLKKLGLPKKLFPEVVKSGSVLGPMLEELAKETGLQGVQVVASCSHDTGAAVAAVPAEGKGWAYLSSGTWSLLGIELKKPIITDQSREFNYTNEIGFGSSIRFLKNIVGLWLVQECRRAWAAAGREYSYAELVELAAKAEPLRSLVNPSAGRFAKPSQMPEKIAAYCRETGQPAPETPGQFIRCACESLALQYRKTIEELELLSGKPIARLHIVGGGTKNTLLNQLAADATQRTVFCGPVEATAIGNILIQGLALGHVASLAALRQIVGQSFPITTYQPETGPTWPAAYARFQELTLAT